MKTERGDMMRDLLKRMHEMFADEPWRDGPWCVFSLPLVQDGFIVWNYGTNKDGSLSRFMAYKSGWYTMPEEWFFEVLR